MPQQDTVLLVRKRGGTDEARWPLSAAAAIASGGDTNIAGSSQMGLIVAADLNGLVISLR